MKFGSIFMTSSILFSTLYAEQSFISTDEYARMLYKNPRGIGCDKCHGSHGQGAIIYTYMEDGKFTDLSAPPINNLPLNVFYQAFNKKSNLMPEYFLTDKEKAYIYYYITKKRENEKK